MSEEGGGFDPCECIWSHELAMRRLLNVLRNSQSLCTDSECYVDDTTPRQPTSEPDQVILIGIMFIVTLLLFFLRPRLESQLKSSLNGNNRRDPPPATN